MSTNFENSEENNKEILLDLAESISSQNGIHVNPVFFKGLGYDFAQAVMLSQYFYVSSSKNGKEFLYQNDNFLFSIGSPDKIKRAKKALQEKGFITVTLKGLPAKSYIKVNHELVRQLKIENSRATFETIPEFMRPLQDGAKSTNLNGAGAPTNNKDIYKDIIKENTKRNPASGSPSSPDVDELSANISSIKPKKVKKLKDYEKDELFLSTWKTLPEYMRGCGPVKAYKMWVKATEKSTKNVEEIKKAITFYLKTLPEWQHPQHFSTFLNQGTWEEFYARAVESDQKQERARALREKQQKEEAERRKQVLKERAQVFETKYQVLKNKLNAGYDTLEEISQKDESLFYDIVDKIREYERKLEEKEAERKKQQELEQKKIDAEKSKIALEDAERELWTYVEKTIDVNAYLERNKKKFPNSYEKFKSLFFNGESLTDIVFGEHSKNPVVDSLKNNILVFLMHELSNEEARSLYNKRNEAWTIWNKTQKEIA